MDPLLEWTQTIAAVITAGIAGFAGWAAYDAAKSGRASAKAAQDSNHHALELGMRQTRAYVMFDKAVPERFNIGTPVGLPFALAAVFKNVGQTPAKAVRIVMSFRVINREVDCPDLPISKGTSPNWQGETLIAAGHSHEAVCQFAELMDPILYDDLMAGKAMFGLAAEVSYEDIYGISHRSVSRMIVRYQKGKDASAFDWSNHHVGSETLT